MSNENLVQLHRKRGVIKRKLSSFINFLSPIQEKFTQNQTIDDLQIIELKFRVENLHSILSDFEEIQTQVETICKDSELEKEFTERDEFFNLFSAQLASANVILNHFDNENKTPQDNDNASVSSNSSNNSKQSSVHSKLSINNGPISGVKLPTINLPKFKGNYDSWLEFKDTFESLIHANNSISEIQKFHYLKASLEADASKIIQSLEFTSSNYSVAWELLCNRFDNSKLLVHNHIKSLFDLDQINKESSSALRNLVDNIYKHLRALETLKQPIEHWDALLIFIISTKLDKTTAREWEKVKSESSESITLTDLKDFLYTRANWLETLELNHGVKKEFSHSRGGNSGGKQLSLFSSSIKCNFCKKSHLIYSCQNFLQLSIPKRFEKIKQLNLCENCLCTGHSKINCKAGLCKICKKKHNTLLHPSDDHSTTSNPPANQQISLSCKSEHNLFLLSTVSLIVFDENGKSHFVKAILDCGSQSNFITTRLYKKLKLKEQNCNILVSGISSMSPINKKCEVSFKSHDGTFSSTISCLVLPKISDPLPVSTIEIQSWNIPKIQLADPTFNYPSDIDLLIGAFHFWEFLKPEKVHLGKTLPILYNTVLGYIVSGPISALNLNISICNFSKINPPFDLKQFWELEEISTSSLTPDHSNSDQFFQNTFSRNKEGRFVVKIPLKHSPTLLGDSKQLAIKRLLMLEKKFKSDPNFKEQYVKFMDEYFQLNHMTKITESSNKHFFPHHGVIKTTSSTTKLRVVFNASAKTTSGWSINDIQEIGPPIYNELFSILLQFRQHPIAVCADIEKMYRQIEVDPSDRYLQTIVWRTDPQDEISMYSLNTVTYGTASAPYLAIRCLKQLSYDTQEKNPTISSIIDKQFYVDDLIVSFSNINEAISICKEINQVLKKACFPLRKWSSNNSTFLNAFKSNSDHINDFKSSDDVQVRTLGIIWNSEHDKFSFQFYLLSESAITKRNILSQISKIFDPLGLLGPCVILVKIMIQKLWNLKLNWDDEAPTEVKEKWLLFRRKLSHLNNLTIERHISCKTPISIEYHGFCDSSNDAYGAVIYVRSMDHAGRVHVKLLCSKTRVSPIKAVTIPRLELCGALLLSRLLQKVKTSIKLNASTFLWSDSQIVLHWIKSSSKQFNVFVGNRISEIQDLTDVNTWFYVNTKENPADLVSRGIMPDLLEKCDLWWTGPQWLKEPVSMWPKQPESFTLSEIPEMKKQCFSVIQNSVLLSFPFENFSKLNRIKRVMAYCLRFINNSRQLPESRTFGTLNVSELQNSLKRLVKIAQHQEFSQEISFIKKGNILSVKHRLSSLSPFIDDDDLLRVGGRLKNSTLKYDTKHPYLLNGKHHLSKLIFSHYHLTLLHAGPQLLLSTVRQMFWPTAGMNVAKQITRSCIICFKAKPQSISPIMADFPKERVTMTHAFDVVGVDYAGPFMLRDKKGRGSKCTKGYISLFICFVTKAIHLEVVTDLTTDSFIAALRRFISRRGRPSQIWSDNGTNFVGAHKQLQDLFQFLKTQQDAITNHCSTESISWKFIPPNSPHFGGLWESGVKSVKLHLQKILKDVKLTFDEFYTTLTQVEAVLNSRPLSPLSSDPNDFQPLTPSHFLIGKQLTALPEASLQHIPQNRLSRYQLVQQLYQHFWSRWSKEYLSILQQRLKWRHPTSSIKIGDLVIIKQENLPPNMWILGRVCEVHPDKEGVVRIASVKTNKGVYKRSVTKLCPLPIIDNESIP